MRLENFIRDKIVESDQYTREYGYVDVIQKGWFRETRRQEFIYRQNAVAHDNRIGFKAKVFDPWKIVRDGRTILECSAMSDAYDAVQEFHRKTP